MEGGDEGDAQPFEDVCSHNKSLFFCKDTNK